MILRILNVGDSLAVFPVQAMYQEMTDWEARASRVKLGASVSFFRHEMLGHRGRTSIFLPGLKLQH